MKARSETPREQAIGGMCAIQGGPETNILQHSTMWVWDSSWLPALLVRLALTGFLLVKLKHGATCSVGVSDLEPRDPVFQDGDTPVSGRIFRHEHRKAWSRPNS
jgi:hypothetical protein